MLTTYSYITYFIIDWNLLKIIKLWEKFIKYHVKFNVFYNFKKKLTDERECVQKNIIENMLIVFF